MPKVSNGVLRYIESTGITNADGKAFYRVKLVE